jgi:imidazolonepropionase-like amidohydrolase
MEAGMTMLARTSGAVALMVAFGWPGWAAAQSVTAFTGATVWDGTGAPAVQQATIVVRDGRIVSVSRGAAPAGATVVDLTGRWVIPGIVDSHGHVTGNWAGESVKGTRARVEEDLRLFARYGVTTVNSLGGEPAEASVVRAANSDLRLDRARFYFAGPVIAAATSEAAAAAVAANADAKVDWIKIRVDDNLGTAEKMPWPAVETVLREAHARKLRVATHLFYLDDAKRLLRAGSDLIAHSIRDAAVDSEVIDLLRSRGVCYVPTLSRELSTYVYSERPAFFDDPFFQRYANRAEVERVSAADFQQRMAASRTAAGYRAALPVAKHNLKVLFDAGIPISMGTDAGPGGRFPGYFEHIELQMMVEAGLTPAQALRSATAVSAQCSGLTDVGTLEAGKWADFLVLDADPLADIANTKRLRAVYIAGQELR